MSTVEVAGRQEPKKSPQDASKTLTDAERAVMQKQLSNPLDFPPEFRTWLEGFIETALPTSASFQALAAAYAWPVGDFRIVPEDLSANTGAYVWTDSDTGLQGLYCNGAAVSQTTYADLYARWGASKYAADSGGNFTLPDTRGRSLFFTGTHADQDIGDSDGITLASRTPNHTHTGPSHTHSGSSLTATPSYTSYDPRSGTVTSDKVVKDDLSISIGGSTGSGGTGNTGSSTVPYFHIGSLVVRI